MFDLGNNIFLSETDLEFRASRSSGPGGQNVNKVNTRITVFFDVAGFEGFSDYQKKRVLSHLATRASHEGVVHVVSQKFRTQKANKNKATERLVELLREALKPPKIRRKTRIPARVKEKRLADKKKRAKLKQLRTGKINLE